MALSGSRLRLSYNVLKGSDCYCSGLGLHAKKTTCACGDTRQTQQTTVVVSKAESSGQKCDVLGTDFHGGASKKKPASPVLFLRLWWSFCGDSDTRSSDRGSYI